MDNQCEKERIMNKSRQSFNSTILYPNNINKVYQNKGFQNRLMLSYLNRWKGNEDISPEFFYTSILSDMPINWIDRVQIKIDCSLIDIDYSFFRKLKEYQMGLLLDFRYPFSVIKIGYVGKKKYLYIDKTLIELFRPVKNTFIDVLISLLSKNIIRHNRKSENGIREEAEIILSKCIVNELEIRTDVSYDSFGKDLIDALGEYKNKNGQLKISSWENRFKIGYLVKCYDRPLCDFVRIEVVLYSSNFIDPVKRILDRPTKILKKYLPKSKEMIDRIARRKPTIRKMIAFLDSDSLEYRCTELNITDIANRMLALGQTANLF